MMANHKANINPTFLVVSQIEKAKIFMHFLFCSTHEGPDIHDLGWRVT